MRPFTSLIGRWLRPERRVRSAAGLADLCAGEAAFVSQKSTIEYCRMRAGINWDKLFQEAAFTTAMEHCRWEAYAALVADVMETCQILFRHQGAGEIAVPAALRVVARAAFERHPVPAGRESWEDEVAAIEARLARALLAAPRLVHVVGYDSAKRVFRALPIHTNLKGVDREVVANNIRFNLCQVYARMEHDIDTAALLAEWRAPPGEP